MRKDSSRAGALAGLIALFLCLAAAAKAPEVRVQEVTRQPIVEEVNVNGTVVSLRDSAVSAAVPGRVAELAAEIGDAVEPGAVLLRLDAEIATAELQAALAEAAEAEAALADARRRYREARELGETHGISRSEILALEAGVAMAEQALERLRATANTRRAELERHTVKAPFAGVVSRRMVDLGEWVTPGTGVMEMVDMDRLRLDLRVSQRYFPRLSKETDVTVALDALPGERYPARIRTIVPVNDPQARTFVVRVELIDVDIPMMPGMAARARLVLDTGRTSVVAPRDALLRHPDGRTTVWVLSREDGNATVEERRVDPGLSFGDVVEIRSGLEPGATVVVKGNEALTPGQTVRVLDGG